MTPPVTLSLLLGGVLSIALGAVDAETVRHLSTGVDLGLIFGGLAALGVHVGAVTISSTAPKP